MTNHFPTKRKLDIYFSLVRRSHSLTQNCTDFLIVPDTSPTVHVVPPQSGLVTFMVSHRNTKRAQARKRVRFCQIALDKIAVFFPLYKGAKPQCIFLTTEIEPFMFLCTKATYCQWTKSLRCESGTMIRPQTWRLEFWVPSYWPRQIIETTITMLCHCNLWSLSTGGALYWTLWFSCQSLVTDCKRPLQPESELQKSPGVNTAPALYRLYTKISPGGHWNLWTETQWLPGGTLIDTCSPPPTVLCHPMKADLEIVNCVGNDFRIIQKCWFPFFFIVL